MQCIHVLVHLTMHVCEDVNIHPGLAYNHNLKQVLLSANSLECLFTISVLKLFISTTTECCVTLFIVE